jgi:hypothetical protein
VGSITGVATIQLPQLVWRGAPSILTAGDDRLHPAFPEQVDRERPRHEPGIEHETPVNDVAAIEPECVTRR